MYFIYLINLERICKIVTQLHKASLLYTLQHRKLNSLSNIPRTRCRPLITSICPSNSQPVKAFLFHSYSSFFFPLLYCTDDTCDATQHFPQPVKICTEITGSSLETATLYLSHLRP